MWYCNDCKKFFEEPIEHEYIEETYGPYKRMVYEYTCPECGSDDIDEANTCQICGEPCLPKKDFCEDCHDEVKTFIDKITRAYGTREDLVEDLIYEHIG